MGRLLRGAVVALTALLLAGCLSSEPKVLEAEQVSAEQRAAMNPSEGAEGGGGAASGGTFVAVDLDYSDAPAELPAGTVPIELVNEGAQEHNVVIEELGDELIVEAGAGETASGEVELEAGEYTYYCDIAGHRAAGMEGTVTVAG